MSDMLAISTVSYNIAGNCAMLEDNDLIMLGEFRDGGPSNGPGFRSEASAITEQLHLAEQMAEGYRALAAASKAEAELAFQAQAEIALRDD